MEALRAQLAETLGALTERDKKFRQLRADQKSWLEKKSTLEARIAQLESENLRLQGTPLTAGDESSKPEALAHRRTKSLDFSLTHKGTENRLTLKDQPDANRNETVTIKRSDMNLAETEFKKTKAQLAEKTKRCEALTAKLAQSKTPTLELSDDEVVMRWNQLREQIRALSLELLSKPFSPSLVSGRYNDEFKVLSPHWKTYASTPNVTCYLFRALIWRYLLRYFDVPCRAFGRDVSKNIVEVAGPLSTKILDAEFQDWRIRTATLVHKAHPIDRSLIDEMATKILGAISPLVEATTSVALEASLRDIVETTAKLSAAFDRSHFVVLMHNEPGGTLTHGFPYMDKLMDMRVKLGAQGVVDLMITPSLLKKDVEYSVMVKAEVIC
ncbi:hypothetical protein F4824DRAFT_497993 [Ustulina deusta]|nr:hypothetical protein F4823DRAFT_455655 [Ustulina deusta]KAI3339868.1 hypothetical protein F4824DRAFT_497993 [Ustulina deusta]